MIKKLLLAVLLPIPVAIAIVSCDSSPSTGPWLPAQDLSIPDLAGVVTPTVCQWGPYWVPCPTDGGTD